MSFRIFRTELTDYEKYLIYKKEDRVAQVLAAKYLSYKPFLVDLIRLADINILKFRFYYNYLLQKLSILNYWGYVCYLTHIRLFFRRLSPLKLHMFVSEDYKLYKLIWPFLKLPENKLINFISNLTVNIEDNIKDIKLYTKSLLFIFETFLEPLPYVSMFIRKEDYQLLKKQKRSKHTFRQIPEEYRPSVKEFFRRKRKLYRFHPVRIHVFDKPFLTKEQRKKVKYFLDTTSPKESSTKIISFSLRTIPTLLYYENLILLKNIEENPYQFINLNNYYIILKKYNIKEFELKTQMYLAKMHNDNLLQISEKTLETYNVIVDMQLKTKMENIKDTEIYKNMDFFMIKQNEEKKVLTEISLYYDYIFKSVIDFIEVFLFKFKDQIDLHKILPLLYDGILNKRIFNFCPSFSFLFNLG